MAVFIALSALWALIVTYQNSFLENRSDSYKLKLESLLAEKLLSEKSLIKCKDKQEESLKNIKRLTELLDIKTAIIARQTNDNLLLKREIKNIKQQFEELTSADYQLRADLKQKILAFYLLEQMHKQTVDSLAIYKHKPLRLKQLIPLAQTEPE